MGRRRGGKNRIPASTGQYVARCIVCKKRRIPRKMELIPQIGGGLPKYKCKTCKLNSI